MRGVDPESSGLRFHWRRAEGGLGFLGVRVLKGKKGEWGWRTNAELGAMVALGRRWRDDIGKGREGEGKGEEEDEG